MTNDKLKRAREILEKNYYVFETMSKEDKKEFDDLNLLDIDIINLYKDYLNKIINNLFSKIYIKNKTKDDLFYICSHLNEVLNIVSTYKLYEYLDDIISIYNEIKYDGILVYSEIVYYGHEYQHNLVKKIIYENDLPYDDRTDKLFIFDNNFFGLLPLAYNLHRMDMFKELIDIVFDFIENAGFFNKNIITATYDFIKYINDKTLLNALNEKIKKAKMNYYELYPLWSVVNKETLLDEKLEINSLKRIYFYSLLDEEKKEVTFEYYLKRQYIKNFFKLLNIDVNIIHDWKKEALDFFENILNNIDKYSKFDASFVSLEKHSNYYKEFIENSFSYLPFFREFKLIDMTNRIFSFFILNSDLNKNNIKLINNCLLFFEQKNENYYTDYYCIGEKIISNDGNNCLLAVDSKIKVIKIAHITFISLDDCY